MISVNRDAPIYLGTADNAVQSDSDFDVRNLLFELNVLTILGFKTLVGTPFVWQSSQTLAAVGRVQSIFESDVGPSLTSRPGMTTSLDYFQQRETDTRSLNSRDLRQNSPFLAEQPTSSPLDWRRIVGPAMRVEPRTGSVEASFRALIVADTENLSDKFGLRQITAEGFGARFSASGRSKTDYHMQSLSERTIQGHFSRASVESELLSSTLSFNKLDEALSRTTSLFQLANGEAHSAAVFTSTKSANWAPKRTKFPVIHRWSVSPSNPYLFGATLGVLGVTQRSWVRLTPLRIAQVASTYNPLSAFAAYYRDYLTYRVFDWISRGWLPSFQEATSILRADLLADDRWRILEPVSRLPDRKFDSLVAGLGGAAVALPFGINPIKANSWAKTFVDTSYRVVEGIGFFNTIRFRAVLRRYLREIELLK